MGRGELTTFEIDALLRQVALPQLGLVTYGAAASVGVAEAALRRRCAAGALAPVFAKVLRLTSVPSSAQQRVLAAALAVERSTIIASSAGVVHGLPVLTGVDVPVVAVAGSRSARTAGVRIVRQRLKLPSRPWHGVRLATPAATLLLLPRFVDAPTLERCIDHSLVHRLVSVQQMLAMITSTPPSAVAGRQLLRELFQQRSEGMGHRSGIEQRVGQWLTAAGLDGWRPNHRVTTATGAEVEVDFAWPSEKVALEISPFFTHGTRAKQERDMERRRQLTASRWRSVEATDPDLVSRAAFSRTIRALQLLLPSLQLPFDQAG